MSINTTKAIPFIDELIERRRQDLYGSRGLIIGVPGSGRSRTAQLQILSILRNSNDKVIVLDTDGSYSALVAEAEGQIIPMSPCSDQHINPFDINMDVSVDVHSVILKLDFLVSWCETLLSEYHGLCPYEKSVIDRCVREVYAPFLASRDDKTGKYDPHLLPKVRDFYRVLRAQKEPAADDIAYGLQVCLSGSLDMFSCSTNIKDTGRLTVYTFHDMPETIKDFSLLTVLEHVWNRHVRSNDRLESGQRVWLFVDDISQLFRCEASADYVRTLFKTSVKWGCFMTGVMPGIRELFENDTFRSILLNCSYLHLLRLSPMDRMTLASSLSIPSEHMLTLHDAPPYRALVYDMFDSLFEVSKDFSAKLYVRDRQTDTWQHKDSILARWSF